MSFIITDLNNLVSTYISRNDTVSLLKSSKNLRADLHTIPFKSFIFDEWAGMNEIRGMVMHLDTIETLEIRGCNFVEHLLLPMKRLKELILINCNKINHYETSNRYKTLEKFSNNGLIIIDTTTCV